MLGRLIRFIKRPDINEQNTGREAYQQYQGYTPADYRGNGGHSVLRSMNATNFATITPGPTHKLNDPTVTGNTSRNLEVQPLSEEQNTASF